MLNPDIIIREETAADFEAVIGIIEKAFAPMQDSDHREHLLVERLRRSETFIPELSLVAVTNKGIVVGHIMLSHITIGANHKSLALAPVSVDPEMQGMGIGSALIQEAHRRASALGFGSVIVLGHKNYYPRFGYKQLSEYGITLPFDVPAQYCMGLELIPGSLQGIHGIVNYPEVFFE